MNLRLHINSLIWAVIHVGSFGLVVTILFRMEYSAAFLIASVMYLTFLTILVCESIFLIISESIKSSLYQSRPLYNTKIAVRGLKNFSSTMVG